MKNFYKFLCSRLPENRSTMGIEEALDIWEAETPFGYEDSQRTRKFRRALEDMAAAGLVELRADGTRRIGDVKLPRRLRFLKTPRKSPKDRSWMNGYEWHGAMRDFAPRLAPVMLEDARIISEWLKKEEPGETIPLCERSYEIFGDEKHLSKWKNGLFGSLKIPLSLIGAYWPPAPLAYEKPGAPAKSDSLLLLENQHVYASFCRWNRDAKIWSGVAFGKGAAVEGMAESLAEAAKQCAASRIDYFGDLDPAGIMILDDLARKCHGIIAVNPLEAAYAWLLRHGKGNDKSPTSFGRMEKDALERLLPSLSASVCELWASGKRIPQEALNFNRLRAGALNGAYS